MAVAKGNLVEYNINSFPEKQQIRKFEKLLLKKKLIFAAIRFLKACKINKITPNFVKKYLKCNDNGKIQRALVNKVLSIELGKKYSLINNLDLRLYKLRSEIIQNVGNIAWDFAERRMLDDFSWKMKKKTLTLKNKLLNLAKKQHIKINEKLIEVERLAQNNVVNLSKLKFSNEEMKILNQGNKNCLQFSTKIEDYIVDIQMATKGLDEDRKNEIQQKCGRIVQQIKDNKKYSNPHKQALKNLNEKRDKVVFTKADKGNKTVILDKEDYQNRMEKLFKEENYLLVVKNPLNKCVNLVNKTLKETNSLDKGCIAKLKEPNPHLPRVYGLPKIHKEGRKMRPIINCIGSPTYKIAKWLKNKFENIEKFESLSLVNSLDLIEKIKTLEIKEEDILVSFDVKSLFPNVPKDKVLRFLKIWLLKKEVPKKSIEDFIKLTKLCLDQNYFIFNGKCFCQKDGLTMGNPLSPFLANLYMSNFEIRMTNSFPYMFKIWHRYVDDILAVIPKKLTKDALKLLNLQERSIQFTLEEEEENCLPFLDLRIIRCNKGIKFGIFRKETHSNNYINANSFNPRSHKFAAFRSMIYRLINVPLDNEEYNKEYKYIINTAKLNGFEVQTIRNMINKCKIDKEKKEISTLANIKEEKKFRKFTFHPFAHNKFEKIFKKENIALAPVNNYSLRNLLSFSNTDKIPTEQKAGIYQLECEDCDKIYIGQTKRNLATRSKEHFRNIKYGEIEKSAVAAHAWKFRHIFRKNPKLLKSITVFSELTPWENIMICRNQTRTMNFEFPKMDALLRKFFPVTNPDVTTNVNNQEEID